ncbi:hypothetical protein [Halomarina litorea]|uniref:hypothetical protein n=1 Tax=Halomarina litorea TaxID=2961595 RepID=UPI0020C3A22E|nr:hypothetical protein [Halomarina sp. BCD28]
MAVRVWVPRGAAGDLAGGARDVLDGVESVAAVDRLEVVGFRPTATDIRVDLEAEVALAAGADESTLESGFGVIEASIDM